MIEFRCNCFLVLPPSTHDNNNNHYTFYGDYIPSYKPFVVDISNIHKLLNHFCAEINFQSCTYKKQNLKLARKYKTTEYGSVSYEITKVDEDINVLNYCHDADAYNTLGCIYALGENVESNLKKAIEYFELADNEMSHYNLASLMACGAIEWSIDKIMNHLNYCHNIKLEYIDIIKANMRNLSSSNSNDKNSHKQKSIQYLFFDTETTGLPRDYNAPSSNLDNWPRLVQLSWLITDENGDITKKQDYIVYPESFTIPTEVSILNGITTEKAKDVGTPIKTILDSFVSDLNSSTYIVGHNVDFDKKIVGAELIRLGEKDIMNSKESFCTMKSSVDYCKIQGYYGYSYPKLQELYTKLFGIKFSDAHNSLADVSTTTKCFWKLRKLGVI